MRKVTTHASMESRIRVLPVIDTLTRYQADHRNVGNYGYLDIARIRADSGSQFTSQEFKEHFWKAGNNLNLAAPKKQYQNHLAEQSWQTINAMARCLLVHARLPDSFMFHALVYLCNNFKVLPVIKVFMLGGMSAHLLSCYMAKNPK
jgi:transposase InsO family protein